MSDQKNTFIQSIDSTPAMLAKATPAVSGAWYGLTDLPWNDIAAILASIYTLFLLGEWIYKKCVLLHLLYKRRWP